MYSMFAPINTFILVKLLPKSEKTEGGLYIPESTATNIQRAKVICSGVSNVVKHDDTVFFLKYQAQALDDDYMVIKEELILGVLND